MINKEYNLNYAFIIINYCYMYLLLTRYKYISYMIILHMKCYIFYDTLLIYNIYYNYISNKLLKFFLKYVKIVFTVFHIILYIYCICYICYILNTLYILLILHILYILFYNFYNEKQSTFYILSLNYLFLIILIFYTYWWWWWFIYILQ